MVLDSATSLLFKIGANSDDAEANISRFRSLFSSSLSDLSNQFHGFVADITGGGDQINTSFTAISAIVAGAGTAVAAGLFEMAKKTAETGEQLLLMSQQVGVSVESLSGLKVVAGRMGVDFDTLTRGVAIMDRSLSPFASSSATAGKALQSLGVSATDAHGQLRPNVDLLADIADKFAHMQDGANKTALAMSIFGRSGAEMIPILDKGGAAIRSSAEEARKLGLLWTQAGAEHAAQFMEGMRDVQFAAQGLSATVGQQLIPVLMQAMKGIAGFAESSGGDIANFASGMASVLTVVGRVAEGLWDVIELIGKGIAGFTLQIEQMAAAANDAAHGRFAAMKDDLELGLGGYKESVKEMLGSFDNLRQHATSDIVAVGTALSVLGGTAPQTAAAVSSLAASYQAVTSAIQAMQDAMAKPQAAALAQYNRATQAADKQIADYRRKAAAGKITAEELSQDEQDYADLRQALLQKYLLQVKQANDAEAKLQKDKLDKEHQELQQAQAAANAAATKMWDDQVKVALGAIDEITKAEVEQVTKAHDLDVSVDDATKRLAEMANRSADSTLSAGAKIRQEYQQQIQAINAVIAAEKAKGLTDEQAAKLAQAAAAAESAAMQQEQHELQRLRAQQMQTAMSSMNSFLEMGMAAAGYRNTVVKATMDVINSLEKELVAHMATAAGTKTAQDTQNAAVGQGIGLRSVWNAAEQMALGMADLASLNFAGAAEHFAAAGAFTALVGSVGAAAASMLGGGGSSGRGGGGGRGNYQANSNNNATGTSGQNTATPQSSQAINIRIMGQMITADSLATVAGSIGAMVQNGQIIMPATHAVVGGALVPLG